MRSTSPKHAKELRQAALGRKAYLEAHPWCELWEYVAKDAIRLGRVAISMDGRCRGRSEHCHEILTRARGGKDEESNLKALCSPCHDWIHGHPKWSVEHGFLRSALIQEMERAQ